MLSKNKAYLRINISRKKRNIVYVKLGQTTNRGYIKLISKYLTVYLIPFGFIHIVIKKPDVPRKTIQYT